VFSRVPNHQRSSAPQLAPTEMTTMDLHMRRCPPFGKAIPLGTRGRSYASPVAEKRRHHQPQERRFHGGMPSPQGVSVPENRSGHNLIRQVPARTRVRTGVPESVGLILRATMPLLRLLT
jgi:hypothetical protein